MNKKYRVHLTPEQRATLEEYIRTGVVPALTQRHARILLKADTAEGGPAWRDQQIAAALEVSVPTVERVRRQFVANGLTTASGGTPTTGASVYHMSLQRMHPEHRRSGMHTVMPPITETATGPLLTGRFPRGWWIAALYVRAMSARFATTAGRSRRCGPNPGPDVSGDLFPASPKIKPARRST